MGQPNSVESAEVNQNTAIQSQGNLALGEFILRDMELTLRYWNDPSNDDVGTKVWLQANENKYEELRVIARELNLDERLIDAINHMQRIFDGYRNYLDEFAQTVYIDSTAKTEGDLDLIGVGSKISQSAFSGYKAGKVVAVASIKAYPVYAIAVVGTVVAKEIAPIFSDSMVRESKIEKLDLLKNSEINRLGRNRDEIFLQRTNFISRLSASLAREFPHLNLPTFASILQSDTAFSQGGDSPFDHVAQAYRALTFDRLLAAELFEEAANMISAFEEVGDGFYIRHYRLPYLLNAAHLREFESRLQDSRELAKSSVKRFTDAFDLLDRNPADSPLVTYPHLIAYLRALAKSNSTEKALVFAQDIQSKRLSSDPGFRALQEYDLAAIYSELRETQTAMRHLELSYKEKPRRDPYALIDQSLTILLDEHPNQLKHIVNSPLVGVWRADTDIDDSSEYRFYVDGSFWQRRANASPRTSYGRWSLNSKNQLHLTNRDGVPDSISQLTIEQKVLTLKYKNRMFTFQRVDANGLLDGRNGIESSTGRILYSDGTWKWANGNSAHFARFTTSRSTTDKNRYYWYMHDDPLVGRVAEELK